MGTRADFYVGKGKKAEWLGSIAWDGYPTGIPRPLLKSTTEEEFRIRLDKFLVKREDATYPKMGWPWPWNDSRTTDYAYAFDEGKVQGSCFGSPWFDPLHEPEHSGKQTAVFPNMKNKKKVAWGKRSGLMVISNKGGKINIE